MKIQMFTFILLPARSLKSLLPKSRVTGPVHRVAAAQGRVVCFVVVVAEAQVEHTPVRAYIP